MIRRIILQNQLMPLRKRNDLMLATANLGESAHLSVTRHARKAQREGRRGNHGRRTPVKTVARDLGACLNAIRAIRNSTTAQPVQDIKLCLRKLKVTPAPPMLSTAASPQGCSIRGMDMLQSNVADTCMAKHLGNKKRSQHMFSAFAAGPTAVPAAHALLQRAPGPRGTI